MYPAIDVAQYVIQRCNLLGKTISNLKLQKILYFVQAEFLVSKGKPCFPEQIEAWDFGPVVPVVYYKFKGYGAASIPCLKENNDCSFNRDDKALVDNIIAECAEYSAACLTGITQMQSPWKRSYHQSPQTIISNESIRDFFQTP